MDKVCIYLRVSTDEQDEGQQLPACLEFCKAKGWENPEIIRERVSAYKNPNRESLKQLEKFDHVVVWAYDRLARNRVKFLALVRYYTHKGIKIHSIQEAWLEQLYEMPAPFNEIMTDLMLQFIGWIAEAESQRRSERIKKAIKREEGGVTASYKGVKWGRPDIRKKVHAEMLRMYQENPQRPIRDYCAITYRTKKNLIRHLSVGYVHKLLTQIKQEKSEENHAQKGSSK